MRLETVSNQNTLVQRQEKSRSKTTLVTSSVGGKRGALQRPKSSFASEKGVI